MVGKVDIMLNLLVNIMVNLMLKVVGEVNIMGATFVYDAGDVNGQFKIW